MVFPQLLSPDDFSPVSADSLCAVEEFFGLQQFEDLQESSDVALHKMAQGLGMLMLYVVGMVVFVVQFVFLQDEDYTVPVVGPPVLPTQIVLTRPNIHVNFTDPDSDWDCSTQHCSWTIQTPNPDYLTSYPNSFPLYEDADKDFLSLLDPQDPPLACIPESFGYSREQADRLFPHVGYPTCEEKTSTPYPILEIDPETDTLTMNCSNGKGWYYLGVHPEEERLGWDKYTGDVHEYKGSPIKLNGREWVYGTCHKDRTTKLEGASYRLRPKKEVRDRVTADMQRNQQFFSEKFGGNETKPVTVLFLVLDSLSRKHFYRKLNQTVEFLNAVDPEKFRLFDFKMHNVMGDNSIPNVYPVWTGSPLNQLSDSQRDHNKKQDSDLTGDTALWSILREKGFATMFLAEFCDNYFSSAIGRRPQVDHTAQLFWCAAERLSGFK